MKYEIIAGSDGTAVLRINYLDEGIKLQGETSVKGDKVIAERYVAIFDADLRRNNSELFPPPPIPEPVEEVIP